MLYTAHLAQGHFQYPPETDLGRGRAPHGDQLSSANLSDIKLCAEEECKTNNHARAGHFFLGECVSVCLVFFLYFYFSLYAVTGISASKPDVKLIVSARYDLLLRFQRNRQTCV